MEEQSKEGKKRKRKGTQQGVGEAASDTNGENEATSNGAGDDGFPAELRAQAQAATEAEGQSIEKGIDAWKKLVATAPAEWAPRRELARVYKKAERWNALIEVLKDAVDKARWSAPEDKVPVLFEMVGVYRDRLKLDVMVVNAFNQILTIQPSNMEAADALAAQYEAMKRWPDLISILRKKASVVEDDAEKIALHLRIASLFLEKFSNQAEAIKSFETVLELDPSNREALGFLKQMYEKRRDWEKLIAVHRRELDQITDAAERKNRRIEVAKLASDKLKKPSVCIDLWRQVMADDGGNAEALGELEKLYEREKAWDDLGKVLEMQAELATDAARKSPLLVKMGILYTEKVQAPERAIAAWQGLLAVEPENRRAQDALKKLYLQQKNWTALEQFYAAQNKWDELVRVLERQSETEDDATRVGLWNKLGELNRDRLGKTDRAQKAFEKALSFDGRNLAAAEALIPLYEKAKDSRRLTDVLRVQLGHTVGAAERQERMLRLAGLLAEETGDKPGALAVSLQAFSEDPVAEWPRAWSERLAGEAGGWPQLVATYEAALANITDDATRVAVLSTIAAAYERELGEADTAIAHNRRILEIVPDNEGAVAALERLYIATGRFSELLAIYDKKLGLATSAAEKLEIRYKLASLYEEEIRQPEKAVELYRAILDQDGSELPALRALDRLYFGLGRWKDLAATVVQEISLTTDATALAELKFRHGGLLEQHLDDRDAAVDAYRDALDLDATHVGARASLEAYLKDSERQLAVVSVLEPIYQRSDDVARLVEVQRIKLEREKDRAMRVGLLRRIGELEIRRGGAQPAYEAYARAFAEDPTASETRAALEALAEALPAWPEVIGLYERALASRDLAPSLQRELLLVIAVAYDEKLQEEERAVEYFRRAQEIEPDDASALVALERLYTRTERWPELIETLKKKSHVAADASAREQISVQIATVWEEMLGNADEAIGAWKEVLGANPESVAALKALDRLYVQRGEFHELADNLQRQLEMAGDPAEIITLLGRLGVLRETKLGELDAAVETYRRVLELAPAHADAVASLERILPNREQELNVAQLLEPVYKARNDWPNLVRVFEVEARHALDPARKIALLHQVAECYETGSDDPERAYDALGRALQEDAQNEETQGRIERLARVLGKFEDLVRRYGEIVTGVTDEELKRAVYHKIALLNEVELGRDAQAAEAYARALETSPADLEAANALEQIYLRNADYPNLVVLLERKVDIVANPVEKKELLFKAAQLHEEVLESPDKAIAAYRLVLGIDETDSVALENLERLYIRLSRWNDLKDVYAKKAELATNPADKKQMLFVLGQVYDRELGDAERAIETYRSILDIDPDDVEAIQALDRLYDQTKRWYDLLSVLEREIELAPSAGEGVSLRFRVGELWRTELKDVTRAVEAYRQVLSLDPTHEATLRALESLMRGTDEPVLAGEVLEPIYESAGEWERVIEVYEVMVARADDAVRKIDLLGKIASLYERRLANQLAAFDAYGRALRVDASNPEVLAHLDRLAAATGSWPQLAVLYAAELDKILDSRRQVEMLLRLARIYEEETVELDNAIAAYRRVSEVEPDSKDGVVALDRLYSQTQRWPELTEVLRREIRLAGSEEEIVRNTYRLGQVFEVALGDLPNAVESYRDILNAAPTHLETRTALERLFAAGSMQIEIAQILEPLYRLGEEWEKLVQIYEVELGKLTSSADRVSMLRRLAEIAEQKLVDQVAAFEWWTKAVKEDPSSELGLEEMLRLARATHQWDGYVATMLEAASLGGLDPLVRRDVLQRLAKTFEEEMGDLAHAEEVLVQVLGETPKDPAALAALDRIYETQGMFENLAAVLVQRIEITDAGSEIAALNLRLGRIRAEALDDAAGAIAGYLAVLERDSRSSEALDALEVLYFRGEQWAELYGVYEKMVDIAPGDEAMSECYARMAKIASDALGDREKAVELWGRVLDLRGDDGTALGALADLHEAAGEWREITEVLERQVRATADPAARIPTYKRLGRIWGEKLSRERNSLESWQKVLEIDPGDADALWAIAANYRSAGAWEELSQTLGSLVERGRGVMGNDELKDLYTQIGELEGETLMRTQAAIDAWRNVLEVDPRDFRALAALEKLFTQEARWEECVEVLERRARVLASPAEQIDVLMQAASIWAEKIGDGGSAADVYERILQIEPGSLPASVELEQLYRQRKSWMKLVELLLARTEFVNEPAGRISLFCQVSEVYEKQLGDRESAFVTLQAAFREDYSNDHVAQELERLATAAGKWNELLSDYTQLVQGITDTKQAADLWVKIGRWYDSALGHLEYAIASAQQALALDSVHVGALVALEDFYRKQARWTDLVSVLARHAEVEPETQKRVDILLQLADTYEAQIGDAAQATLAFQRALDADPQTLDAINALERLYRRTQAWDRLVDVLARKSQTVSDGEVAVKLRLQVGELWEDRLGDNDRAVEAYREVLSVDPQSLPALKALERLYEKTGKMDAYLENLEHQLDVMASDEDRVALYQRMASVWEEQFGKPGRAAESLEKVLQIDDRNQRAYRDLERVYRQEKTWEPLVETYRKHILITTDVGERTDLYYRMGQVYEEELRDPDRAIEAYGDILTTDPDHTQALTGLSRLYELTEQWDRAIEMMQRLVRTIDDPKQKVDLSYRLGKIFDEQMKEPDTAEERLMEALSLDPSHVPAMLSLLNLYKRRGDWLKAAQLMTRAEAHTANPLEKTRLLFEAAKIAKAQLGNDEQAGELYARTLELDPEHMEAAEPLAELYFERGEWAKLVPILEMLARKADKKANRDLNLLYYRLAKAADRLGDGEKALKYYKQAYDLDSTYLPTLIDRAALLYQREAWDDAFKIYQTILVHHRDSQKDDQIVEIFHRLGRIKLKLGERSKAVNMFEKALEIQPGHRPTLGALTDIYTESGDFEAVIKQKRALLAASQDINEKFTINEQIAELYKDKLQNPQKAIAAYLEAQQLKPTAHHLLHNLLDLFGETKQWKKAVEILLKLADLEKGDDLGKKRVRAKYLEAAGNIARDELHATDEAVELYNQALDEDPDNLKTFERIDKIMTAKKDWKNQERAYRRMIKRIGLDPPAAKRGTLIALVHALGEIYRSRLKDMKASAETFELAIKLDPDALPRHAILAELYQILGPETHDKAIKKYTYLVKHDAAQMSQYMKTLHRLYMETRQYDRAWCVAAALVYLRKADPQEQQFCEQYRVKGFVRARARLTEELWQRNIYHPDEDRHISHIFAAVSGAIAAVFAKEHKDWNLKRKDRRQVENDQLLFSKVFNYVNQVLGVPQPELYLRPEAPGELDMANARDKNQLTPSFVVGASLLQGRPEKELAYVCGKKLSLMRPDHFVRWPTVIPTVAALKVIFLAALKLVQPAVPVKPDIEAEVKKAIDLLRRTVPPQLLEQMAVVVQKFLAAKAEADLHRWSNAVDLTATRAGFLMCNDLEVAARLVAAEPVSVGTMEPKDKVRDLLQWSISDEYFALREHLGLTIGQQG